MRATVSRDEALRLLKLEHQETRDLIAKLTDDEMIIPNTVRRHMYSDQNCSFKDLLAHLVCYEAYSVEAIEDWKIKAKHWAIDAMKDPIGGRDIHYNGILDRRSISLQEQIDEYNTVADKFEQILSDMTDDEWREEAFYPVDESTDLGGMIEDIMVVGPRPMYRHLPVHVPNADAYTASLRITK